MAGHSLHLCLRLLSCWAHCQLLQGFCRAKDAGWPPVSFQPFCLSIYSSYPSMLLFIICSFIHPSTSTSNHSLFTFSNQLPHARCLPKGQACVEVSLLRLCALAKDVSAYALDSVHKPAFKHSYWQRPRVLQMHALRTAQVLETSPGDAHALLQPRASWTALPWGIVSFSKHSHVKVAPTTSPALVQHQPTEQAVHTHRRLWRHKTCPART